MRLAAYLLAVLGIGVVLFGIIIVTLFGTDALTIYI
jgi:hypothetical protein